MINDIQTLKKAIYYRAHHRGTKEADWVIGGFIREKLESYTNHSHLFALRDLINLDDESFFKQVNEPDPEYAEVVSDFRRYKASL